MSTFPPDTPVAVNGCAGFARIDGRMLRGFKVYLLTAKIGLYWTYPRTQLRRLSTNELARFLRDEKMKEEQDEHNPSR